MNGANNINGSDGSKETKTTLKVVFGTSNLGKEGNNLLF